jgi:hypothetical protein
MKSKILQLVLDNQEPNKVWHCDVLCDQALNALGTSDNNYVAGLTRELIAEGKLQGTVASDNTKTQVWPTK